MKLTVLPGVLLSLCPVADAAVYRCTEQGRLVYTDHPCAAETEPAQLPALTTVPATKNVPDLARQYDDEARHEAEARAAADRDWLARHGEREARERQIRKATLEHRLTPGMTRAQVRQSLGAPTRIEDADGPAERWFYEDGGEHRTVRFKDGLMAAESRRQSRK